MAMPTEFVEKTTQFIYSCSSRSIRGSGDTDAGIACGRGCVHPRKRLCADGNFIRSHRDFHVYCIGAKRKEAD